MTTARRRAVIVLGMHRSGTSALTGLLGQMGCDLPVDLMAPAEMNAKGFFESNKISYFNEDLLASAGMTWFDLNRFPDSWYQSPKAEEFQQRARDILRDEYGGSHLFVIKDPRVCRLVPFWADVLAAERCEPLYVVTHRDPMEVAGSLVRWANYEPRYGQLLWLRHVLDAEAATRGKPRVFVSYDQVMADWRAVVARIGTGLNVVWPRPPERMASEVDQLLSRDLRHIRAEHSDPAAMLGEGSWLRTAFDTVEKWSRQGEDPADYPALDAVRRNLDDADGIIVPVVTDLLGRHRDTLRLTGDVATIRDSARATERELQLRSSELDKAATELDKTTTELAHVRADRQKHATLAQTLRGQLDTANIDLAKARRRPIRNLGNYLKFKLLMGVSSSVFPLPGKVKARLRRSAEKRSPKRSLMTVSKQAQAQHQARTRPQHLPGKVQAQPDRKTILVVTHDASRTGAPILALNLVQTLATHYNVVTLCLRGGELADHFQAHSVAVWIADQPAGNAAYFSDLLAKMQGEQTFAFAITNSIEARHILGALRSKRISSVSLLHEFASYTLPRTAFSDAFRLADHVVFSSDLTLENALSVTGQARLPKIHVLPQGKCEVPHDATTAAKRDAERARLDRILRPEAKSREFVVIGAGYVQIRKGVDLFIETARRVLASPGGERARFVWIGGGYLPDKDAAYSVYIKDQLDRSGLGDRVTIVPETSEIEHVYGLADLLLLPSRLDPLPNVAIDAMVVGLPVLCFDKATGIAHLLDQAGLGPDCVADYLDTSVMADRVLALATSQETYDRVSARTRSYAAEAFRFADYTGRIERLALSAVSASGQIGADIATIEASQSLRPDFMLPHDLQNQSLSEAARFYATDNWTSELARRPEPGYHPVVHLEALTTAGEAAGDAYATFLRKGRPAGPWLTRVISETAPTAAPGAQTPLRVGLHIHAYYPEEVGDIARRLALSAAKPDLYLSVTDDAGAESVRRKLSSYAGKIGAVRVVPNAGRDIGPFLTEFGKELVANHDIVGHLHTKKSAALANPEFTARWTSFLYENLIGGDRGGQMIDRIMAAFAADDQLGLVFAEDPHIMSWSRNESVARDLAKRLNVADLPTSFNFPIGTMFWMRSEALRPFVDLGLGWQDYPEEPVALDGTMLHALERLFGVVPPAQGFSVAVTNVRGVSR